MSDISSPAPNVLVVVHAGSACGSANFNLGKSDARSSRDFLAGFIERWNGHVIVIDGSLCDELEFHPQLRQAIDNALKRAKDRGLVSTRRVGEDPDQIDVVKEIVLGLDLPRDTLFEVTGAWASHGEEGCVNSVYDALHELGYTRATVSDSAVFVPEDQEDEDTVLAEEQL